MLYLVSFQKVSEHRYLGDYVCSDTVEELCEHAGVTLDTKVEGYPDDERTYKDCISLTDYGKYRFLTFTAPFPGHVMDEVNAEKKTRRIEPYYTNVTKVKMREFLEGFLYKYVGLPYEEVDSETGSLYQNIYSGHTVLCFSEEEGNIPGTYLMSGLPEECVDYNTEGATLEKLFPDVGFNDTDGNAKFVVIEVNPLTGYCTVVSIY
jgi:hypothetical protein